MKKINVLVLLAVVAFSTTLAQANKDLRFVEVNGTAELEVVPDEIFVIGVLQEEKAGELEKVETNFLKQLQKSGIANEDISLADLSGEYASAWFKKDQLVKEKTYQIKVNSAEMLGKFLSIADEVGLKNVQIIRTDLSNREEVEQELRIKAVKDAQNKAQYMSEAIGSKIGVVLEIRENYISVYRGNERVNDLMMVQMAMPSKAKAHQESVIGFKKIRMEVKIMAKFEILN